MRLNQSGGSGYLATGGIAAILASTCCLGPLLLVMLGFSGAWIGNLAVLEPYRPFFLMIALGALLLAAFRIFRPVTSCGPDTGCATPRSRRTRGILFAVVAILTLVGFAFPYFARFFY